MSTLRNLQNKSTSEVIITTGSANGYHNRLEIMGSFSYKEPIAVILGAEYRIKGTSDWMFAHYSTSTIQSTNISVTAPADPGQTYEYRAVARIQTLDPELYFGEIKEQSTLSYPVLRYPTNINLERVLMAFDAELWKNPIMAFNLPDLVNLRTIDPPTGTMPMIESFTVPSQGPKEQSLGYNFMSKNLVFEGSTRELTQKTHVLANFTGDRRAYIRYDNPVSIDFRGESATFYASFWWTDRGSDRDKIISICNWHFDQGGANQYLGLFNVTLGDDAVIDPEHDGYGGWITGFCESSQTNYDLNNFIAEPNLVGLLPNDLNTIIMTIDPNSPTITVRINGGNPYYFDHSINRIPYGYASYVDIGYCVRKWLNYHGFWAYPPNLGLQQICNIYVIQGILSEYEMQQMMETDRWRWRINNR